MNYRPGKSTLAADAAAAGFPATALSAEGDITGRTATSILLDELGFVPRNIPAVAPDARRAKRALVKAFGIRQYKKVKV